ncbi:MAG TPA: hypothetical protein VMU10_11570 [Desulfomonilia bacterium]|nr:hypothetical protein [Desulfomonilia bacterium]
MHDIDSLVIKNFTLTNLSIGPRTDAYTGLWPITIDVANGVIRSSDEPYTRLDLDTLRNSLKLTHLPWR